MSELTIPSASPFDAIKLPGDRWSARDLMPMLGYDKWQNFESAIERACRCRASGSRHALWLKRMRDAGLSAA